MCTGSVYSLVFLFVLLWTKTFDICALRKWKANEVCYNTATRLYEVSDRRCSAITVFKLSDPCFVSMDPLFRLLLLNQPR